MAHIMYVKEPSYSFFTATEGGHLTLQKNYACEERAGERVCA